MASFLQGTRVTPIPMGSASNPEAAAGREGGDERRGRDGGGGGRGRGRGQLRFRSGSGSEQRVCIVVEYCEPCGFEATYQELASAVREEYPDIHIESRLGGTGAFEIEINGQLVFSKLENGGFPYEKDLIFEAIRRARNGRPAHVEKITNSRPPCVILTALHGPHRYRPPPPIGCPRVKPRPPPRGHAH
eukprot:XP_027301628.1 migration and invasion enhancer 1 [Anas platyrhynchos]